MYTSNWVSLICSPGGTVACSMTYGTCKVVHSSFLTFQISIYTVDFSE